MAPASAEIDPADAARAARDQLDALLDAAGDLRATLPATYATSAETYVRLLLEANARLNLTRLVDPGDVARLHLLDALAGLPLIDAARAVRVVDIGSGGGVPAIPLAIARPEVAWVMVESVGKKAAALTAFVEALKLHNVAVVADRAETIGRDPAHREGYSVAMARACAPLPVLVELALPLAEVGGFVLAWKGPLGDDDDEVIRGRAAAGQVGGGRLRIEATGRPELGGHTFAIVPKERPTPARFPRRPGEPSRRPLA